MKQHKHSDPFDAAFEEMVERQRDGRPAEALMDEWKRQQFRVESREPLSLEPRSPQPRSWMSWSPAFGALALFVGIAWVWQQQLPVPPQRSLRPAPVLGKASKAPKARSSQSLAPKAKARPHPRPRSAARSRPSHWRARTYYDLKAAVAGCFRLQRRNVFAPIPTPERMGTFRLNHKRGSLWLSGPRRLLVQNRINQCLGQKSKGLFASLPSKAVFRFVLLERDDRSIQPFAMDLARRFPKQIKSVLKRCLEQPTHGVLIFLKKGGFLLSSSPLEKGHIPRKGKGSPCIRAELEKRTFGRSPFQLQHLGRYLQADRTYQWSATRPAHRSKLLLHLQQSKRTQALRKWR